MGCQNRRMLPTDSLCLYYQCRGSALGDDRSGSVGNDIAVAGGVLMATREQRVEGLLGDCKYLGKIKFTFCMHSARYSHEEV